MSNWQKVYNSDLFHRAEIVKSLLQEHSFNPVLVNKMDSSYHNFGDYEVYVSPEFVIKAKKLIEDAIQS